MSKYPQKAGPGHPNNAPRMAAKTSRSGGPVDRLINGRKNGRPDLGLIVPIVALSSVALGGASQGWSVVVPLAGIGGLLIIAPIRSTPKGPILLGALGLLICSLWGLLPNVFFQPGHWRSYIQAIIPDLPLTLSPQPWLTLRGLILVCGTMLFGVWTLQWQPSDKTIILRNLTLGMALMAVLAIGSRLYDLRIPFWQPDQGFGPFANRNQSGTFFGITTLMSMAFFLIELRQRRWSAIGWLGSLCAGLGALLLSNSRAALALTCLGAATWMLWRLKVTLKRITLIFSCLLIVGSVALLFGHNAAERLPELFREGFGFRLKIYRDAAKVVGEAPLTGVGIGNFEPVFRTLRRDSLSPYQVVHPESDWIWSACELGILSVVSVATIGVGLSIAPGFTEKKRENDLVAAGLVVLGCFVLHSFIDVPGHRFGTLLPAILIAGLSTSPPLTSQSRRLLTILSVVAGALLLLATLWIHSIDRIIGEPSRLSTTADWQSLRKSATRSLSFTPLNPWVRLARGDAEFHLGRWIESFRDFRIALRLEPNLGSVPYQAGLICSERDPAMALRWWNIAMDRTGGQEKNDLFALMLQNARSESVLSGWLLNKAATDLNLAITAMRSGRSDNATIYLLIRDRKELGARDQRLLIHAEATQAANQHDFEKACKLMLSIYRPIYPPPTQQSEAECRAALIRHPGDFAAAFHLFRILSDSARNDEALHLLDEIASRKDCPIYLQVAQAELLASMNDWPKAWIVMSGLSPD